METYHRRRYKNVKQPNGEMVDTEMREQNGISGADTPPLVRHDYVPTPLSASADCSFQLNDADEDGEVPTTDFIFSDIDSIKVGCVYELDHIHLPPRTPAHLRSIRVAMVTEKAELNVAVRFPSMNSLKTYFCSSNREMYPELDDKFVMGRVLAAKVLLRQVSSHEFAEKKHLEGFWLVNDASVDEIEDNGGLKKGMCLQELKCKGMVRWGIRRQVKFLERHEEKINVLDVQPSSSFVKGSREFKPEANKRQLLEEGEEEEEEDDEEGDDNDVYEKDEEEEKEEDEKEDDKDDKDISEQEETVMEDARFTEANLMRKRYKLRNNSTRQIATKIKREKKRHEKKRQKKTLGNKARNICRELLVLENPKDRWSAERYQLATKNLLEVMQAKGATAANPILRPDLRAEARKRIGDTGLLDHLLKHMAGKLAPGGKDRFRRRHNADGAMEYWLESADLVNIRKEAGVDDPYWIPPPGWTPGDCPTQDPVCAKELRLLKEKISTLERNAEEMVPRKQYEEEIVKLRREIEQLVSCQKHKENDATEVLSNPSYISQTLSELGTSLKSSKAGLENLLPSTGKYEEQLMVISDFVKGIELQIKKLMTNEEGKTRSDSALIMTKKSCAEKEKRQVELEQKSIEQEVVLIGDQEGSAKRKAEKTTGCAEATAEDKAAKIERLKSGFRICKPQGTFLWPSMARNNYNAATGSGVSPQVVVQVEDLLMVPTPPSVSSSSALAPPHLPSCTPSNHHRPPSPVKPVAERRAVTVTISAMSNNHGDDHGYSTTTTTTTTTTKKSPNSCFNLNDFPSINPVEFSDNPSSQKTITTTTTVEPRLGPHTVEKREMVNGPWDASSSGGMAAGSGTWEALGCSQKKLRKCSSSSASCLSAEVGNWLALATANSASDEYSQG